MLKSRKGILTFVSWFFLSVLFVIGCNQANTTNNSSTSEVAIKKTDLIISIAATLKDAMAEIKLLYGKQNSNINLIYNIASSVTLQQQIEHGAAFDMFFSGGAKQMDALQQKNLLVDGTRKNLLKNQIALIVPKNSVGITDFKDLTNTRVKKVALGEPKSTTVGQSTEEVLTTLKILAQVKSKAVYAKDVRQALRYVELGNTDAGIVFFSDAKRSQKVKLVRIAPATTHSLIVLPVAILKSSKNVNAAKDFIQFLSSEQAKRVFNNWGFTLAVVEQNG